MTPPKPPHLLYVAWGYPPSRSGGVYRALATANAFANAGWNVTVLTATRETFLESTGIDASLEERIDPRIDVKRIPFDVPAYQNDLRAWSRARATFPELWNAWQGKRDRHSFPEPVYGAWHDALVDAAVRIHLDSPVDLVVGTSNPHVDLAPGFALRERYDVPFVLDYRDAWQLDVFSGRRVTKPGSRIARLESRLVEGAQEVWFVNEPIRAWHQVLYPKEATKLHVVANGYDDEFATFTNSVRPDRKAGLVFGYIGTISAQVPLDSLLEGWRLARSEASILLNSRLELHGYLDFSGIPNERTLSLLNEYASDGVEFMGPVSKAVIASTYESFDLLVLALGKGKYVTSGKVFEYVATGLPVLSIHDPGNAASPILEGYPLWVATPDLTVSAIAATFVAGAQLAIEQTSASRASARSWARRYERGNQLNPRIAELTRIASGNDSANGGASEEKTRA